MVDIEEFAISGLAQALIIGILLAILALEWFKRKPGTGETGERIVRTVSWLLSLFLAIYTVVAIGYTLPQEPFAVLSAPWLVLFPFAVWWVWESQLRSPDKVIVGGALLLEWAGFLTLFPILVSSTTSFLLFVLLPAFALAWLGRRIVVGKIPASIILGVGVLMTALSMLIFISITPRDFTFALLAVAFLPSVFALYCLGISSAGNQ